MSDLFYSVPSPLTSPIKSLAQKKPQDLGLLDLEIQLLFGDSKEAASLYLPLYEAYLKHRKLLNLPLDIIKGDNSASSISQEYDNLATSFTSEILLKFKQLYPDVEFGNLYEREKSPKSLKDKIRDSEIERIAALMAVNSDVPQKVDRVSQKLNGAPINIDVDLLYTLLCQKIFEYATIKTKDKTRLASMDMLDYDPETAIKGHYIIELQKLFYNTPSIASLQSSADELLSSGSSLGFHTKQAIARVIYSKIKSLKIPTRKINALINELNSKYGENAYIGVETEEDIECAKYSDFLGLRELKQIEQNEFQTEPDSVYEDHFHSSLERLIDEQEYLRIKDLKGFQIIISNVPLDFQTTNPKLKQVLKERRAEYANYFSTTFFGKKAEENNYDENKLIAMLSYLGYSPLNYLNREPNVPRSQASKYNEMKKVQIIKNLNDLSYKDPAKSRAVEYCIKIIEKLDLDFTHGQVYSSDKYKSLNKACNDIIAEDFSISLEHDKPFLQSHGVKIVRESIKHKNKPNGYKAEHIKFELGGNPLYTIEAQFKSQEVENISHGNSSAAHSGRIGKGLVPIKLLANRSLVRMLLDKNTLQDYMKQVPIISTDNHIRNFYEELLLRVPKFIVFREENGQFTPHKLSIVESATKYYEGYFDDRTASQLLEVFYRYRDEYNNQRIS